MTANPGDVVAQAVDQDVHTPKLDGQRVALRGRVAPDLHRRAVLAARELGMSLSDYLAFLIVSDTHETHQPRARQEVFNIPA